MGRGRDGEKRKGRNLLHILRERGGIGKEGREGRFNLEDGKGKKGFKIPQQFLSQQRQRGKKKQTDYTCTFPQKSFAYGVSSRPIDLQIARGNSSQACYRRGFVDPLSLLHTLTQPAKVLILHTQREIVPSLPSSSSTRSAGWPRCPFSTFFTCPSRRYLFIRLFALLVGHFGVLCPASF